MLYYLNWLVGASSMASMCQVSSLSKVHTASLHCYVNTYIKFNHFSPNYNKSHIDGINIPSK